MDRVIRHCRCDVRGVGRSEEPELVTVGVVDDEIDEMLAQDLVEPSAGLILPGARGGPRPVCGRGLWCPPARRCGRWR